MLDQAKTDRLLALLQAQRREAVTRSGLHRGTRDWRHSTERLDDLNERIMQPDDAPESVEAVGMGVRLDLDSRPVEDRRFRRHVVASVRSALGSSDDRDSEGLPKGALDRARVHLRQTYPEATLSVLAVNGNPATLIVRADRRARTA